MTPLKIGILREGKVPEDNRTPLKPRQCKDLMERFNNISIVVQSSMHRCCKDEDYRKFGIEVVENMSSCDLLLGIKEVRVDWLIPEKTYMFFSHTTKKQAHNQKLLQAIAAKNDTLIDYEMLTDEKGNRLIGFGKWAGIVGAHYALVMIGQAFELYHLKAANKCVNLQEVLDQYEDVVFPNLKYVVTGSGRVATGAIEVMHVAGIQQVTKEEFLTKTFAYPVFVQLFSEDLYENMEGQAYNRKHFHAHPEQYRSIFEPFTRVADVLINCIFWKPGTARLFECDDIKKQDFKINVIADVSCDVNGAVPITFKETTIQDPVYGVDKTNLEITAPYAKNTISLMAVSNLPNELPLDASRDFGIVMMDTVIPKFLYSQDFPIFERATIIRNGELTPRYHYLNDYLQPEN